MHSSMAVPTVFKVTEAGFSTHPLDKRRIKAFDIYAKRSHDPIGYLKYPPETHPDFSLAILKQEKSEIVGTNMSKIAEGTKNVLERKRQNVIKFSEINRDKWKELEKKEKSLQRSFLTFNKFVINNSEKQRRLLQIIERSQVQTQERDGELKDLTMEVEKSRMISKLFHREIEKHIIYINYLHKVMNIADFFRTEGEILKFYDNILHTSKEAQEKYKKTMVSVIEDKFALRSILKDRYAVIIGMKVELDEYYSKYYSACSRSRKIEATILELCTHVNEKMVEYAGCMAQINTLYMIIRTRGGDQTVLHLGDYKNQLKYINNSMGQLQFAVESTEEREARVQTEKVLAWPDVKKVLKRNQKMERSIRTSVSKSRNKKLPHRLIRVP